MRIEEKALHLLHRDPASSGRLGPCEVSVVRIEEKDYTYFTGTQPRVGGLRRKTTLTSQGPSLEWEADQKTVHVLQVTSFL